MSMRAAGNAAGVGGWRALRRTVAEYARGRRGGAAKELAPAGRRRGAPARWAIAALAPCAMLTPAALPAPAAAEECPNVAFRTGPSALLPDCRAYELVSPAFKNTGSLALPTYGPDGSSGLLTVTAAVNGLEGFPGAGVDGTPAYYSLQRTSSGWVSVPDDPPGDGYTKIGPGVTGDSAGYLGADADGQTTVWGERAAGQPENSISLFERLPDRSIVDVGPLLPPSTPPGTPEYLSLYSEASVKGVSADASHLVFSLLEDYWPFDSTKEVGEERRGNESLYEYAGTGNTTPMLVGVSDGRTVVDGRTLAAGELIGRCGEELGGPGSTQNAMSADGGTVFFTVHPCANGPQVEELFARIGNGEPGARTVAISEPSEEDCSACYENKQLISAGQLANGVFVGASEDGSKVFFTSSQELLPGAAAGENLYEYDAGAPAGDRVRLIATGGSVNGSRRSCVIAISQDGSHVYFASSSVLSAAPNSEGQHAQPGVENKYVYDTETGDTAFITDGEIRQANVTPDGRFLVFESATDLTPDDTSSGVTQVFEYDAQTGVLARVSIGEDGYNNDGNVSSPVYSAGYVANNATIVAPRYAGDASGNYYEPGEYSSHLSVSADGSYVFFQSIVGLTPQAVNQKVINIYDFEEIVGQVEEIPEYAMNVYEYHDGRVSLISDGHDFNYVPTYNLGEESVVHLIGTDESGDDVLFTTADRLVGQDTDSAVDIYDARIDGGFSAPAVPPACEGEGCQGRLSGAPTLLSPGSEFQAGGNPPLAAPVSAATPKPKAKVKKAKAKQRKCKKGTVRGRCVKGKARVGRAGGRRRAGS
jgi:hypothetical protein